MRSEQNNGLFVVFEGSDGSGKATQLNLLKERLKAVGYEVVSFDFPQYDKESGYFVKKYLNGAYGPASDISPYTASLFYALDRYEASPAIAKALEQGKIVLANRFAGSNMAHQGSKFDDEVERRSFFVWTDNLEFQLLNIPRPNINFYLRVPAEIAYDLITKKPTRSYTKVRRDEHEISKDHLRKSVATYDLLCQLFPKDFKAIEATKKGKLMSVPEINNLIWEQLKPLLPGKKAHASHSVVVTLGAQDKPNKSARRTSEDKLTYEFKNSSLLLKLYLHRLAPGGITHDFDGWTEGNYKFYSPNRLPKEVSGQYRESAERLSILHQQLQQKADRYLSGKNPKPSISAGQLLQPAAPLGGLSNFILTINKTEVERVAGNLLAGDTEELQWAARQLYAAARQAWPHDFDRPLESTGGPMALNNIIAKMASHRLPQVFSADESIKLIEAHPRLEFDLLSESLYPFSNFSLDEISEEVSSWPYSQKYQSLKEAASQPEVLKKVTYKIDVISDHLTLDKIIQASQLNNVQIQAFTPRYGYEVPQLIEDMGAEDLYDSIFDESLKLYSLLQAADREDMGAYATLLGHKLRWQISVSALDLMKIFQDKSLQASPTLKNIGEKLAEAHPLLWEVISEGKTRAPAADTKGKARVKPLHRQTTKKKRR